MFRATFIGHQGWLLASETTCLMVDPLLRRDFGHTPGMSCQVYPPRRIDLSRFPPLDGVILTHEHEDHFDPASIDLLDRRIAVYISSRSSIALRGILDEMGFTVTLLSPGQEVRSGDLAILPLTPDHVEHDNSDEWDVVPWLIHHLGGDGSFFSGVDVIETEGMFRAVTARVGRLGVYCMNNGSSNFSWANPQGSAPAPGELAVPRSLLEPYLRRWGGAEPPAVTTICGNDFSFSGAMEWLNHNLFVVDSAAVLSALAEIDPRTQARHLLPGQTLVLEKNQLVAVEDSPFLSVAPRSEWPSREYRGDVRFLSEYPPATGIMDFPRGDFEALLAGLGDFAHYLYGTRTFRVLHSLSHADGQGRKPTFALALLISPERDRILLEYRPQGCDFVPATRDNPDGYLAVAECWASDLLALTRGEIGASAILVGKYREWTALPPGKMPFQLSSALWLGYSALRRPRQALGLLRRLRAGCEAPAVRIPAAQSRTATDGSVAPGHGERY